MIEPLATGGKLQLGFFFDQSRCSGCFTCITACRQWHSIEYEVMSWRRVETVEEGTYPHLRVSFVSLSCLHCQNPLCALVCPTSAIFKRPQDGIVLVDPEKCLGEKNCGLCRNGCPYRIPQFNPHHDFKMEKCNLCPDRLDQGKRPICVDACPMHALDLGPLEELSKGEGYGQGADGFTFSQEACPSIVLKRKR
jgi:anaerobic dimethyl sulfoxide reductase subunit B (iron-sulfur subunit)